MAEFLMPSLGADMEDGVLVEWMIKPGQEVHRGDVVAVVETVKGAIEIENYMDGVVAELLAVPGEKLAVGAPLARIHGRVETRPGRQPAESGIATARAAAEHQPSRQRRCVSPAARHRAAQLHVDLTELTGTGAGGTVTLVDVEQAATSGNGAQAPCRPDRKIRSRDQSLMRQAVASAMARSKREIPHYYLSTTVDMHRALDWLARRNATRPPAERLLYALLLIKATALAVRDYPEFNGFFVDQRFEHKADAHVGVAIALRSGGLVAPALHDVASKDVGKLMTEFRDLVIRARTGTLRSTELSDPTITVSSLGERGVETILPIIYTPQVAILGFGAIVQRPWVVEGELTVRPLTTATLAADHRVSDGRRGGLFLSAIVDLLQTPEQWAKDDER